jgi:hypothetical protein
LYEDFYQNERDWRGRWPNLKTWREYFSWQKMEVIQTVFDQLQADIQQKLKVLEKQVVFILASKQNQAPSEDFLVIRSKMDSLTQKLEAMESRFNSLEKTGIQVTSPVMNVTSAGLEGLLMKPMALPSPALSARSENQVVLPIFQRQIVIPEQEEVEPDEEVLQGVVAEETGGIDEEELAVDEGDDEAEDEDEAEAEAEAEEQEQEEEEETVELEEFIWKGKTYFKTPDHMVYKANDEGDVEDEPFAKYDPKTNTLKRI